MMIFDSDTGILFFWYNNSWIELTTGTALSYSAGTGISIDVNNTIQNTLPDQNVTITGEGATIVTGSYPNFTIQSDPDDADADPNNEIITYGEVINSILTVAEGDDTIRIDVSNLEDSFNGWDLNGNAGTNPVIDYIGTSDNNDLSIRVNNNERMRLNAANGNIGIGTNLPQQPLHVNGNVRSDSNLQLNPGGFIDDDNIYGENTDDWIRLNGAIDMKSNTDIMAFDYMMLITHNIWV